MRQKLIVALAVVALVVAAGCTIPSGSTTEKTTVHVSSGGQAMDDFQRLTISITKVGVYETKNDTWRTTTVTKMVDLTNVQGDRATFVGSMTLPEGDYSKVYLSIDYVGGALEDGTEPSVEVQSKKLAVEKDFRLDGMNATSYVVDLRLIPNVDGTYVITGNYDGSGPDQPINASAAETTADA